MVTSRPNIDPKGRYGVVATAKLLGIHRSTVWRWVEKGWIRPIIRQIDNRTVFRGSDIIAAWEACF